jgi:myo-inositol-1(or 4)-monophosphatase
MAAPSISDAELHKIYRFAIQLGKDAGQILLDGLARRRTQGAEEQVEKLNAVDIVTQTDHGS